MPRLDSNTKIDKSEAMGPRFREDDSENAARAAHAQRRSRSARMTARMPQVPDIASLIRATLAVEDRRDLSHSEERAVMSGRKARVRS
jgi:hypothetical protein